MSIELKGGGATDLQKITPQGASLVSYDHAGNNRVQVVFAALNFTATAAEGLVTLTAYRDHVAGAAATTHAVTGAKRMRLLSLQVSTKNAGAAGQGVRCILRINPAGAAVVGSPPVVLAGGGTYLAIANVIGGGFVDLTPAGIDITGSAQLAVTQWGSATAGNDVILTGYEYSAL